MRGPYYIPRVHKWWRQKSCYSLRTQGGSRRASLSTVQTEHIIDDLWFIQSVKCIHTSAVLKGHRKYVVVDWASCFLSLSLADWLLGTLLFPGGARSCHPAGTQHRIQTDIKPGWGEFSPLLPVSSSCSCPSIMSCHPFLPSLTLQTSSALFLSFSVSSLCASLPLTQSHCFSPWVTGLFSSSPF